MTTRDVGRHAPAVWSFSALRDARECPRRWSLRAEGRALRAAVSAGSDESPGLGLLRGRVCHAALERMLEAHRAHAGPAWGNPSLQGFWRVHFPRGIVGLVREEALRLLGTERRRGDPSRDGRLRRDVDEAVPSLAVSVGSLLRLTLSRATGSGNAAVYAEVPVEAEVAPGQRWRGRIDAVIQCGDEVTLVDFKTGTPSLADMEQLVAYACLFERDEGTRALGAVRRLAVLNTRGGVEERDAPIGEALDAERSRIAAETRDVARRLASSPPEASPAAERCPRCDVRGRCDDYWTARRVWEDEPARSAYVIDAEAIMEAVLGDGRALRVRVGAEVLFARPDVSLLATARTLGVGARVRLVGARLAPRDEFDDGAPQDRVIEVGPGGLIVSNS